MHWRSANLASGFGPLPRLRERAGVRVTPQPASVGIRMAYLRGLLGEGIAGTQLAQGVCGLSETEFAKLAPLHVGVIAVKVTW